MNYDRVADSSHLVARSLSSLEVCDGDRCVVVFDILDRKFEIVAMSIATQLLRDLQHTSMLHVFV